MRSWQGWLVLWLAIGLAALAGVSVVAAYEFRHLDRVYDGVQVEGIRLDGLTLDESIQAIEDGLTPFPADDITLYDGNRTWTLTVDDLGVAVDARTTASAAYQVGRSNLSDPSAVRGLLADLFTQWYAFSVGTSVTANLRLDESRLAILLKSIAEEVDSPPQESAMSFSEEDVLTVPGRPGRMVDVATTHNALVALALAGKGGSTSLVVRERAPALASVDQATVMARAWLNQPVTLNVDLQPAGPAGDSQGTRHAFPVARAHLRRWLSFSPVRASDGSLDVKVEVDRALITDYLNEIAAQIEQPASNAELDFDPATKEVSVLKPSQAGQTLDLKAGVDAVEAALLKRPRAAASNVPDEMKTREIALPIAVLAPKVDSNKIAEMGIVELVSQGTTFFKGSIPDRVHNIVTAAERFRHVVVPPGEEFSFDQHVGNITKAEGYVEGLIIGAERTAVGVGGGVCQVSTTAFRAAFNGGFPITERHAHGYVVSWYGEPGIDATISTPNLDFRFRNDTGHFLLVKSEVDAEKGTISFLLYGTKPDRIVESDPPIVSNKRAPERPLYEENPALAPGTIKQVDWAKTGEDVIVVRRVRYPDGKVKVDKFVSNYQPWRAIYQFGPGAKLPSGALIAPGSRSSS